MNLIVFSNPQGEFFKRRRLFYYANMLFKAKANSIMENLAEEIRNSENLRKA